MPIDSVVKVTYWPRFLLSAYEERHKASYRGAADFRLYKIKTILWLRLTVDKKAKNGTQLATIGAPQKVGPVWFTNT